jgi:hypothetical protein
MWPFENWCLDTSTHTHPHTHTHTHTHTQTHTHTDTHTHRHTQTHTHTDTHTHTPGELLRPRPLLRPPVGIVVVSWTKRCQRPLLRPPVGIVYNIHYMYNMQYTVYAYQIQTHTRDHTDTRAIIQTQTHHTRVIIQTHTSSHLSAHRSNSVKRDLINCQKRPNTLSKET